MPLIKDYDLFNFTSRNDMKTDNHDMELYLLLDYDYPNKSLGIKNFILDAENGNINLGIIRGPSGVGKSKLLNYLEYHFSLK